jgi:methylmalonyl-CoA mutase
VPQLKTALERAGHSEVMIVVGGVVPPQDYEPLRRAGATAIFPPGTVIAEAAVQLLKALSRQLGHKMQAAE